MRDIKSLILWVGRGRGEGRGVREVVGEYLN